MLAQTVMVNENVTQETLNGTNVEVYNQMSAIEEQLDTLAFEKPLYLDESVFFYTAQDGKTLQIDSLRRVRELQTTNDSLQRQINQLDKEMEIVEDPLVLSAEKERLQTLVTRNAGEMLKIHVENHERLKRIAHLEAENCKLQKNARDYWEQFMKTTHTEQKVHLASEYYLAKSKLEKNRKELRDLKVD